MDHATRTLFMSMRHMSPRTLRDYVEEIKRHSPGYMRGITSFMYDIARWLNENGLSGDVRIPFLFTTSETLSDGMRQAIEQAFCGRVFDYYGSTEGVPMITQCRAGRYHIVPESGFIEFLRPDGSPAEPGEPAEMIVTSLRCRLRPLLRYRVMDTASYSLDTCPCGLNWPVVKRIHGRLAEWIVTRDGRTISCMGDLIMKSGTELGFSEIQVTQVRPDHFVVQAIKGPGFSETSEHSLRQRFIDNMYHDVTMDFVYVDRIEKSDGGKRRLIVSKLAQELYNRCYDAPSANPYSEKAAS
jgi:phenylacetate-CoA ligase